MNVARSLFALLPLLVACAPPPRCPEASPPAQGAAPAAAQPAPSGARLAVALRQKPGAGHVEVTIRASAEPAALGALSITPDGGPASLHLTSLEDDAGAMTATPVAGADGRVTITLPRPVSGDLRLAYTVDARPRAPRALPGVDPDPNRLLASGEPLLLLPDALDERLVHVSLAVDLDQYVVDESGKTKVDAASSFGVGKQREFEARGRELRGGFYMAGTLGRALFDTPEGHDEAAWIGYTSFDPRPIAADVAAFRTAARELFRFGEETPLTLLIVADNRPAGAFSAARRARSVVVRVGAAEAWTGSVRIAVAAEVLHAWIGGRLWVGPADAAHEAEAAWFTEGLARHLARDLLFRYGLVTSAELAEEIHGLAGAALTSPWAKAGNAEVAAHVKEAHARTLLVARGALYATALDQRLRKKSQGKRALVDLLRPLFAKAQERRGPLTHEEWVEAASAELGAAEKELFAGQIQRGQAAPLDGDALGPCFRGVPREYEAFDLGFDEDATRAAEGRRIQKLRPGGPAEKGGLREGDTLEEAVIGRGRADVFVTITVKRGGEAKTVKYLPVGAKARGRGFARKKDVAEEACAR